VIYLWLLVSAGYGLFKRDIDPDWDRLRWPLFVSVAIGASWISVALIAPVLATVLIWVMLAGALLALRLAPTRDWPWLALPLGLYAGWLTAASSVALATVAAGYGLGSTTTLSWVGVALALLIADHDRHSACACPPTLWQSHGRWRASSRPTAPMRPPSRGSHSAVCSACSG
jgi:hypothetical protein